MVRRYLTATGLAQLVALMVFPRPTSAATFGSWSANRVGFVRRAGNRTVKSSFSDGDHVQCPPNLLCKVASWGRAGSAPGSVTGEVNSVARLVSTQDAFAALQADGSVSVWGDSSRGGSNAPAAVTTPIAG